MKALTKKYLIIQQHKFFFEVFERARRFDQRNTWHPERWLLDHLIQVSDKLKEEDLELFLAGVFHDLGKLTTARPAPRGNSYQYFGHEKISADWYEQEFGPEINSRVTHDVNKVVWLIQNHMKILIFKQLSERKRRELELHLYFEDLKKLRIADEEGRDPPNGTFIVREPPDL